MRLIAANGENVKIDFRQDRIHILIDDHLINDPKSFDQIYPLLRRVEDIRIWFGLQYAVSVLYGHDTMSKSPAKGYACPYPFKKALRITSSVNSPVLSIPIRYLYFT